MGKAEIRGGRKREAGFMKVKIFTSFCRAVPWGV